MQDDDLGQDLAEPAIPLQGKLDVGVRGVGMSNGVNPLVVAADRHGRAVKQLKESNRQESM